jgi:hypothetical protein
VALAVNALGIVSKQAAAKLGWRQYRSSDVKRLVGVARAAAKYPMRAHYAPFLPKPRDASWYDITLRVHPLIAGALFGFLPLPTLEVIDALEKDKGVGAVIAARCLWFCLAGALSGQLYGAIKFAFDEGKARLSNGSRGASRRAPAAEEDEGE